jgi:rhodanese-related sulfurtransferase
MKKSVTVGLILVIIVGIGVSTLILNSNKERATGTYATISPDELSKMLQNKDFLLVNVHIPYQGEIPGTDLFIPYNKIDESLDKLPDKSAKIVVYCMSGRMSAIAASRLAELGYTNIIDLEGGMIAWKQKGYPLLNS